MWDSDEHVKDDSPITPDIDLRCLTDSLESMDLVLVGVAVLPPIMDDI